MTNCLSHLKFPEDSANLDYDVFEEFIDGSTVWRSCVLGMGNAEQKLQELARESNNKFFAINLREHDQPVIRPHSALRPSVTPAKPAVHRAG